MWSSSQIELEARKLLFEIEKHSDRLWPNTPPDRLFMCEPEAACRVLGLRYLPDSHLGTYGGTATAGLLDRANKTVMLSSKQSFEAQRFTGAHEVGHYLLHPGQLMFRDRTLYAHGGSGRPPEEQQADFFAACFLIPPKLLRRAFRARFPVNEPLVNTGAVCFNLDMANHQYLESLPPGSMEFAVAVARTEAFNGNRFKSLAALFNVSHHAMAIRLQEMGLVH